MIGTIIRRIMLVINVILIGAGIAAAVIESKIFGISSLTVALLMTFAKIGVYEKVIKDLNSSIDNIELERSRFSDENNKLNDAIEKMKMANTKLLEIQKQSQSLLTSLMSSGDKFTDFGKILEETTNKNLSLADKMQILIRGLSEKEFKKMDLNNDGVVSADEFKAFFNSSTGTNPLTN